MSVISDQIQKFSENVANNNSLQNEMRQPKRDSRHTISDEEQTTEWIPEIPFWNVSLNFEITI